MIPRAVTNELSAKVGRQLRTVIFTPQDAARLAVLAAQHRAVTVEQVDQ